MGWLPIISRARSNMSDLPGYNRLAYSTACGSELSYDPTHQISAGWRSVEVLVFQTHRLPLELAHLMEWLHLDPFDIFHGRDEPSDALNIRRIIGGVGHEGESDPYRLR